MAARGRRTKAGLRTRWGQAVTRFAGVKFESLALPGPRGLAEYALELVVVAVGYFVLARAGLALAALHPSAIPIWPPAGFALAAVLLRGLRIWPAIFVAAWAANAPTDMADAGLVGSIVSSAAIAAGNTLAALAAGYLINIWSDGCRTFDTPVGVAKFAFVCLGPSTMISATVGVVSLCAAGHADWASFVSLWITWWLRDVVGALVIAPVVVLWVIGDFRAFNADKVWTSATALIAALAVGVLAFSPLIEQTVARSALSFLAAVPLLWAALRGDQRDTATVALVLSCFALWGALAGGGPFAGRNPNDSFLPLVMFMLSTSGVSLALSADVAARRRVEARLHQQNQMLRAMFSQAVVGIVQADTTGRLRLVNDRFCEIVQRPAAELLQMRMQDLADPEDLSHVVDLLGHAVQTGEGFVTESRHVLPDGTRRWVRTHVAAMSDQGGAVRHLMAVAEDVTARRQAEENLQRAHDELQKALEERTATLKTASDVLHTEIDQRKRVEVALRHDIAERRKAQEALVESEWRFRMVIQGVTDYAIFMLDQDGYITHWNMGAQRIHQYTAAEVVGQHFGRFYTEEERQRGEPARALQVAGYEGKYAVEGRRARRDESEFWASAVIEAVRDEVGTLVGFVNITRDITERREAQASLERAQEQLAQSQKMEALGQLTGSIAHDFNNLLMIVSGHAQLLRRRLTDPKHLQAIDAVHSAANRGESLTRQLLAFSRRQPLNPVIADLKERVEAVHEMLVGSLRGNVQLKCDIAADVWPVEVDVAEFELALLNVAVNARDAMPGGGIITLSARNVTLKKSDGVDGLRGRLRGAGDDRYRRRHRARRAAANLRAVLHHQGDRQRHRARIVAGLRLFPPIGRYRRRDQHGRQRHRHHHLSAAQARGARQGGGDGPRAADAAGSGHDPRGRGQRRGCRRHGVPGRAARLPDLAGGKRHRGPQPAAARRQDRSGVQRRRHAGQHERHRAGAGNRQPLPADCGPAHQRLQRRGADRGRAVHHSAQAVPAAGAGQVHPRSARTRRRSARRW